MKILITGGTGFIGTMLRSRLKSLGHEVHGGLWDVTDPIQLQKHFAHFWNVVYHMASITDVKFCNDNPKVSEAVNLESTKSIVKYLATLSPRTQLIYVSSSLVYKTAFEGEGSHVVTEETETEPQGIYGLHKFQSEEHLRKAVASGPLTQVTIARPFTHTHSSQKSSRLLGRIWTQLTATPENTVSIEDTNLNVGRDIGAGHDLVSALVSLIDPGSDSHGPEVPVYNICSGRARNLKGLIEIMADQLNKKVAWISTSPQVPGVDFFGSHKKLTDKTGWAPRYQSDEDFIRYYLNPNPLFD
jgi:nucleoside-diphosphate-sugar epimerase